MTDIVQSDAEQATESERTTLLVVYVLHAAAILVGLTAIVGVIISHIKIGETQNEFIRSHHRWLIRTFWFGMLWSAVSFALTFIAIGLLGFIAVGVWWIYRIVRGILNFSDRKPMPMPA